MQTITHRVRTFLRQQGAAIEPWSGLDATYSSLHALLERRRDDPTLWGPLEQLLREVQEAATDPKAERRLAAPAAELLSSWDAAELASSLRRALSDAAQAAAPLDGRAPAYRSLTRRLSPSVLGAFLVLGLAAAGCSGDNDSESASTGGDGDEGGAPNAGGTGGVRTGGVGTGGTATGGARTGGTGGIATGGGGTGGIATGGGGTGGTGGIATGGGGTGGTGGIATGGGGAGGVSAGGDGGAGGVSAGGGGAGGVSAGGGGNGGAGGVSAGAGNGGAGGVTAGGGGNGGAGGVAAGGGGGAGGATGTCVIDDAQVLASTVDDSTLSTAEKTYLCSCMAQLSDTWRDGLTTLFETGTPDEIATALEEMLECCAWGQTSGSFSQVELLQGVLCDPYVGTGGVYKGVSFPA
ncbi:MAG TPA: hypothetical protein PLU22_19355 [Polyangiaceae bacterium]|nr:hypothetical protein [Polyangiaceae bacterium]